jgi:preprotein translocase SecE subunit
MENQYQKIVNIAYLTVAALVIFLVQMGLMQLSNLYDLESKVKAIEYIVRGTAVVLGVGVFFVLFRSAATNLFMNEVVVELLTKVTWPTSKDTSSATVVVMITVVLAGIMLAFFDWIFTLSLNWLWTAASRAFM